MRPLLTRLWDRRRIVVFYGFLLLCGWLLGGVLKEIAVPEMRPMNEPAIHLVVMSAFVLFVVLAAIPFVPGAEVGFTLLLIFGGQAAPLVYFGMVGSLIFAYVVARLVPASFLGLALNWFGLRKAANLILELDAAHPDDRLNMLSRITPRGVSQRLLRHRYLLLAVALNTPGNSLLGGGGGLAFVAGASRLFAFWPFLATIICAVAPVPLFFLLT
ncbi:hypothetical protein [Roseovarius sp. Pro17]|uniref:hypothetical protein n=1 Tax=Roseovarius sp. Pro17 TaxID=3108175 RepID=UPI002D783FE2|nr:hypothetical protein [Roseovarius sp. Pro17]